MRVVDGGKGEEVIAVDEAGGGDDDERKEEVGHPGVGLAVVLLAQRCGAHAERGVTDLIGRDLREGDGRLPLVHRIGLLVHDFLGPALVQDPGMHRVEATLERLQPVDGQGREGHRRLVPVLGREGQVGEGGWIGAAQPHPDDVPGLVHREMGDLDASAEAVVPHDLGRCLDHDARHVGLPPVIDAAQPDRPRRAPGATRPDDGGRPRRETRPGRQAHATRRSSRPRAGQGSVLLPATRLSERA